MTNLEVAYTAASSTISLLLLGGLLFWLYPDYRVNRFRQDMFALRDELFSLGQEGALTFDSEAYRLLWNTINGFIRFGHRLTLINTIIYLWWLNEDDMEVVGARSFDECYHTAVDPLDSSARERLRSIVERMHTEVAGQIVFSSPVLMMLLVPVLSVAVMKRWGKEMVDSCRPRAFGFLWRSFRIRFVDRIDSAALMLGCT